MLYSLIFIFGLNDGSIAISKQFEGSKQQCEIKLSGYDLSKNEADDMFNGKVKAKCLEKKDIAKFVGEF